MRHGVNHESLHGVRHDEVPWIIPSRIPLGIPTVIFHVGFSVARALGPPVGYTTRQMFPTWFPSSIIFGDTPRGGSNGSFRGGMPHAVSHGLPLFSPAAFAMGHPIGRPVGHDIQSYTPWDALLGVSW